MESKAPQRKSETILNDTLLHLKFGGNWMRIWWELRQPQNLHSSKAADRALLASTVAVPVPNGVCSKEAY